MGDSESYLFLREVPQNSFVVKSLGFQALSTGTACSAMGIGRRRHVLLNYLVNFSTVFSSLFHRFSTQEVRNSTCSS